MVQNPTIPVFDHLSMKNDHLSNEMIEFQEQHYAALPLANNPLIGPGHTGPWYDWVMLGWAPASLRIIGTIQEMSMVRRLMMMIMRHFLMVPDA
jgi:hypothetical protein